MDPTNPFERIWITLIYFMTIALLVGYLLGASQECVEPGYGLLLLRKMLCLAIVICLLSVMSCILFLFGAMSLLAFGVILIGLIPTLDVLRRLISLTATERLYIGSRPALELLTKHFGYFRYGEPPNADLRNNLHIDFLTTTYIRVPSQSFFTPLLPITSMWNGKIIRYNENVIVLKDEHDFGNTVRWWKAAKRGKKLMTYPAEVGLEHPERFIRALELIAEMTMIGDSVLHYHEAALKEYAKSDQIRDAVHTLPSSVYSRLLGAIGLLDDWGIIDDAKKERFIEKDFSELGRGDKYGMLFFILLNTSHFFDSRKEEENGFSRTGVSDVIGKFEETNEDSARKSITERWLSYYGRDPDPPFGNQDEDEGASMTHVDAADAV